MKPWTAITLSTLVLLVFCSLAHAETCEYDTRWGVLVMSFLPGQSSIIGHYPYKNGNISGSWNGRNVVEGSWYQNDGSGYFRFNMHQTGFTGKWRYSNDRNWRGDWNGQLRGCF